MHILAWRKSTYSPDGSNCVEIAPASASVRVRDSKIPAGPRLAFSATVWSGFIAHVTRPDR
ncbi:DUF397 domain-containing protein [Streptomyces sp. NPDC047000]|uniref:DUF397 domain-containing protein n=1 Tax=Streptomyces sp. NPDC047000 TaxID=3155474 RepID=UPI003408C4BD